MPIFEKAIKLFSDIGSETSQAEVNYLAGLHLMKNNKVKIGNIVNNLCINFMNALRFTS